eukprot:SAG31_NODE_284_length_18497_cov_11.811773_3_plen_722_part_00
MALGLPENPRVLSQAEQILLVSRQVHRLPLRHYAAAAGLNKNGRDAVSQGFIVRLLSLFGQLQESGISPELHERFLRRLRRRADAASNDGYVTQSAKDALDCAKEIGECYTVYSAMKDELALLDMADLMLKLLHLLRAEPRIGRTIAHRYDHILIDEFQDLSPVQLQIVRQLWKLRQTPHDRADTVVNDLGTSLLAVGDENQAIFGWRFGHLAGTASAISGFYRSYPEAQRKTLSISYRCKQGVLDAATAVISGHNPQQPSLKSARSSDSKNRSGRGEVSVRTFDSASEECEWIAEHIRKKVKRDNGAFSDFAVLARHNSDVAAVAHQLKLGGVPVQFIGGTSLYTKPWLPELMHLLAAIVRWPGNGCYHLYCLLAAAAVAKKRHASGESHDLPGSVGFAELFGIQMPLLSVLMSLHHNTGTPLRFLLQESALDMVCNRAVGLERSSVREELCRIDAVLTKYEGMVHSHSTSIILTTFLQDARVSHELEQLQLLHSGENIDSYAYEDCQRLADGADGISQFLRYVVMLEQQPALRGDGSSAWAPPVFLVPYLHNLRSAGDDPGYSPEEEEFSLSDASAMQPVQNKVTVSTIHKAKGLEWRYVILSYAIDEERSRQEWRRKNAFNVPILFAMQSIARLLPKAVDLDHAMSVEMNRLLYVAITRARDEITFTTTTSIHQSLEPNERHVWQQLNGVQQEIESQFEVSIGAVGDEADVDAVKDLL